MSSAPVLRVRGGPSLHVVYHNNDEPVSYIRALAPAWRTRRHWPKGQPVVPCRKECPRCGVGEASSAASYAAAMLYHKGFFGPLCWKPVAWFIPDSLYHIASHPQFTSVIFEIRKSRRKYEARIIDPTTLEPFPTVTPFDIRAYLARRWGMAVDDLVSDDPADSCVGEVDLAIPADTRVQQTEAVSLRQQATAKRRELLELEDRLRGSVKPADREALKRVHSEWVKLDMAAGEAEAKAKKGGA